MSTNGHTSSPISSFASSDGGGGDMDVDSDTTATNNGGGEGRSPDPDATPRPQLIDEDEPVRIMPPLGPPAQQARRQHPERYDVTIVGAGPAGLMLGLTLARLGIKPLLLDERAEQTPAGRADGLQPKTIETLRMLGLADELLGRCVRVYDICLWHASAASAAPARVARETHYPAFTVDLVDPFILIGHQGMVESVFVADLAKRGVGVRRCHRFEGVTPLPGGGRGGAAAMEVLTRFNVTRDPRSFETDYLVGCDGAHSRVRRMMSPPSAAAPDEEHQHQQQHHHHHHSEMSAWGVLDGEVDTDFPDIWTKAVVYSERAGSILILPRERDMTRLYIEMRPDVGGADDDDGDDGAAAGGGASPPPALVQAAIMRRAAQILQPYRIRWRRVEWFGQYRVSQRVAARFASALSAEDNSPRVFIAGDAAHTHSPKAAQGMNTALHDSWNLAWKLNLAARGLCRPAVLLGSYEAERQKIARDLVAFDFEHANELSRGDPAALADNFKKNVRFISGVGVEYGENELNTDGVEGAGARPGCTLPPGKVRRYIDANPVDVQLDIPVLGQFRVYMFVPDVVDPRQNAFVNALCDAIAMGESLISRLSAAASKSYIERPRVPSAEDLFKRPERYTAVSQLFVFALITSTPKEAFELTDLPPVLSRSPWTIYLDDTPDLDTQGSTCTAKYLGPAFSPSEVAVLNVRPDGYAGSLRKWDLAGAVSAEQAGNTGRSAAAWLDEYFGAFLTCPS